MMQINTYTFANGLRLVHYRDCGSKFAVVNTLYSVGSRNESDNRTGLAHLFEHLMFGGTDAAPDFDAVLQKAGGRSNAWTSNDLTNFYDVLPLHNLATALWLEADRMRGLSFSTESLEVQRKVVIEEFKETVLNAPYGDMFHIIASNAYCTHPYNHPVIGRDVSHIEQVTGDEVREFFYTHYYPANAVLAVVGDIDFDTLRSMVAKYFEDIPNPAKGVMPIAREEAFTYPKMPIRRRADVPEEVIMKSYRMGGRCDDDYIACDTITDLLSTGPSSRFQRNIVTKGIAFRSLDCSVWGTLDPGLLFINGSLLPDVEYNEAEDVIAAQIDDLCSGSVTEYELQKTINKAESLSRLENCSREEMAYKLAYGDMIGDTQLVEHEYEKYRALTPDKIVEVAQRIFKNNNALTLYYGRKA